jgi:drug/metabolite transporter (DMT)-like permease
LPQPEADTTRIAPVAAWMAGALLSFIGAALAIRTLAGRLDVFEINLVRTGGALVILLALLPAIPGLSSQLRPNRVLLHVPRNLVHALGGLFWTLAVAILPLATVFSLEFTAPAWAALLAYPILGERIRKQSVFGILACLVGVLVILRPAPGSLNVFAILPIVAACCFGLNVLLTRKLTRTETTFAILFWMMVIQVVLNAIGATLYRAGDFSAIFADSRLALACLLLVISGLMSQFCLAKALQIGEAMLVMPLDFLRVPLIAGIGYWIYGEPLDMWVLAGFAVIALGITVGLMPARPDRTIAAGAAPDGDVIGMDGIVAPSPGLPAGTEPAGDRSGSR